MKPDVYIRLYPGDWLKDTLRLDATAMGAYFLLIIDHRGKPGIPSDDQTLRTIARVRECDWSRIKGQISVYFEDKGGMWVNNRSIEDWARDCEDHRIALERSKLGNEARWGKPKESPPEPPKQPEGVQQGVLEGIPQGLPMESQSESESESESENRVIVKMKIGRNVVRPSAKSDEEWLAGLRTSDAYPGINVQTEHSKWLLWCETKKRKPTRARFLAWLNRIDKPMGGTSTQRKPF